MAQQPYMGSGLGYCAAVLSILMWLPEPSGRQPGDLGEKLGLNFAYETFLFMP
jgi:hypothetical protein